MALQIVKNETVQPLVNVNNNIENLNDMLFEQLHFLQELDVNDENFDKKKEKICTFAEIADRIIKNNEFGLRVKVWNAHQAFRIAKRNDYEY